MRTKGVWKSMHQGEMLISEMEDSHLINAINYMRERIVQHYIVAKKREGVFIKTLLDKWENLLVEAAKRHLEWDYDTAAPYPNDFKGQTYNKRTTIKPARGGKPRASRSISI